MSLIDTVNFIKFFKLSLSLDAEITTKRCSIKTSSFSKIFVADSFFLQTKSQNKIAFKYVNVFGNKIQNKKTHFNSHMRFVFLMHPYCL